ncbi:abortive infection bacteriophage resistance protein [Nocardia fluminea]|uniref:Abortive infection bacteriophage resistance protein n=2 Tax=Nocardia fluminea TaxID=134984 RepID=A0A2N3V7V3_9NOCA|nr:abortive infection bacteriophage resistance protein [Nocardia fluminea]
MYGLWMPTVRAPKPFLSIEDQIALLSARGMTIESPVLADQWLRAVGYYRLSGYAYPFRSPDPADPAKLTDNFVPGTTFAEVIGLYEFDRHLKNLMLSGLERIEVAMRSQIGYTLGGHGPLAYEQSHIFRPQFCGSIGHTTWLSVARGRVNRAEGHDAAVDHHIANYGGDMPIWVLTDVLDFGDLSKLFAGMTSIDQQQIMQWFSITPPLLAPNLTVNQRRKERKRWKQNPPLANWLLHLTIVRNTCAHHSRLWNRRLTPVGTPALAGLPGFDGLPPDQFENVYGTICLVAFLLATTSPGNTWTGKIARLVDSSFTAFDIRTVQEMGFPSNWKELPLWTDAS